MYSLSPRLLFPFRLVLGASLAAVSTSGAASSDSEARPAPLPTVRVENVRRAFFNGEHNGFTDLIRWRGRYWLAFRSSPDGHGSPPSARASIIILASDDAQSWTPVHRFSVEGRDTRDPHLLAFQGRLFVYSATWYVEQGTPPPRGDLNRMLGYGCWTDDGSTWEGPLVLEGTYGHYIWRCGTDGKKAYLFGARGDPSGGGPYPGSRQSALLESEDGLRWRFRSLIVDENGSESAFVFDRDGGLTAITRRAAGAPFAVLSRSLPPYESWNRRELPGFLGGPLLARWGDRLLVGGRRIRPAGPKTVLSWLVGDELVDFAELPSGGDNSYPGFVEMDARRGLVSWYSSHEKDERGNPFTAVYLAELVRDK